MYKIWPVICSPRSFCCFYWITVSSCFNKSATVTILLDLSSVLQFPHVEKSEQAASLIWELAKAQCCDACFSFVCRHFILLHASSAAGKQHLEWWEQHRAKTVTRLGKAGSGVGVFICNLSICNVLLPLAVALCGTWRALSLVRVGLVESKIRLLVENLERHVYVKRAHINPQSTSGSSRLCAK